jgi:hypothetical protein
MLKAPLVLAMAVLSPFFFPLAAAAQATDGEVSVNVDQGAGGDGGATVDVNAGHSTTNPATASGVSGGPTPVGAKSSSKRVCTFNGAEIECTSSLGVWSEGRQCFVQRVSPQPPADHAIWEGRTEGTIYLCAPPGAAFSAGAGSGFWFWAPSSGSNGAPALVDPVTLAEKAVERMDLASPTIGMTPLVAGAPLLVGMDAWLWIDNAGPRGYGPITRTATAGPVSVTATAKVTKVVWELGDGTRLTCRSAGTPWSSNMGVGASPTCGHRYLSPSTQQRDGTFTVHATAHWKVEWTGAGQSGEITFTMDGEREQPVTEVQVLQTR